MYYLNNIFNSFVNYKNNDNSNEYIYKFLIILGIPVSMFCIILIVKLIFYYKLLYFLKKLSIDIDEVKVKHVFNSAPTIYNYTKHSKSREEFFEEINYLKNLDTNPYRLKISDTVLENENEICCICYDHINDNVHILLECKHRYHLNCINEWIKRENTCPLCKKNITLY